jgi:branched-chain amino acid transport system permease protein
VILKEILQSGLPYLFHGESQLETIVFGILLVGLLQLAPTGVWPWLMARLRFKPHRKRTDTSLTLPARIRAAAAPEVLLQIEHARKQFGSVIAVNDVSFDVQAREIVALIGPNGAGKSTTFNLITGVLASSGGTISVLGKNIDNAAPQEVAKLGIARTFQHVKLVPDMSVLENVAIGAHLRGRAGAVSSMFRFDRSDEAKLLAEAARQIERVGLSDQIDALAGNLSLGQQRIVEIARALCVDPILLLLDEPAAGLRHLEKQRLATLLRSLRDGGMSVLLVEHDMGFVMDLADRVVVLDFGTKIAEGTPAAIKTNPEVIKAYLGAVA